MATLAKTRAVCKALPGATSEHQVGRRRVFSVGGRMFAVMDAHSRVGDAEVKDLLTRSHALVAAKLSGKTRESLGIE